MTDIPYMEWNAMSDREVNKLLGNFIRQSRLRQNKTQSRLAEEAGVARSTLSLFEKGENASLLVFIQLLRVLGMLHMLEEFRIKEQLSPLQLARLQHKEKHRAGGGER
ncbi:MAG TPA: helix-turn-helix transcriptional regulator [Bacteroidales bacterium]|nr:helix-turn-helix transcriptional regulator [Bacteroidales bacterium]HPF02252.1 helix-turn-helix transcriptional regulator [Bacteroidales bacterium]HPJ58788.1 helix-turn-helix transcriptional regulator [Bacteroidales bacterium]HPR11938.1 helix-turn-helix transcriptional regulator [Bacteroidales bacterium]